MQTIIKEREETNAAVPKKSNRKVQLCFLIFLAGCLVGWVYEEVFYYFEDGFLSNRGFLYGPYLPVYGFGALFMVLLLKRFRKNPALFFLLSVLVTGVLEYTTGLAMWLIWHQRWWDYTGLYLNIGGFVCLRSVLSFGIGGLVLIYLIEPALARFAYKIPKQLLNGLCIGMAVIMVLDAVCSLLIRHPVL